MKYLEIAQHYEKCLETKDTLHGKVDWESSDKAKARYEVLEELIQDEYPCLLDFGCGLGGFGLYLIDKYGHMPVEYTGLDISQNFIDQASIYFKEDEAQFICQDILVNPLTEYYDYIVCNGTFTEKRGLSDAEMYTFVFSCLKQLWDKTQHGLAFNLMDPARIEVDKRRPELYFVYYDVLVDHFIKPLGAKNWQIRADYGTNDYTVYLYKDQ